MPQFASFVSMRPQPGGGAGFPIGEGLDITRDGRLYPKFAADGPLYVNQLGEIALRASDGLEVSAHSPASLRVSPATISRISTVEARTREQAATQTAQATTISAQAATIASHTSALAALSPLPAPGAAVSALALGVPTDLPTALLAIAELQTTVAVLRSRLIDYGVIDP